MKTGTKNLLSSHFTNKYFTRIYFNAQEAKEEYILKLSILLTELWMCHHLH
jgi:hypothetical protein